MDARQFLYYFWLPPSGAAIGPTKINFDFHFVLVAMGLVAAGLLFTLIRTACSSSKLVQLAPPGVSPA